MTSLGALGVSANETFKPLLGILLFSSMWRVGEVLEVSRREADAILGFKTGKKRKWKWTDQSA